MRVAQGPQRLEEAFLRQHEAHVSGNGLHDDRRDVLAVQVENVLDGPHVIVGGKQGVADRAFRHARRAGDGKGRHAGTRAGKEGIGMAMITADELQHLGASGHATGQTQGGHGRLRARVHHAHHIHAGERVHDHAGKLDLGGTGSAVAGALSGGFDDRLGHLGMGMPEQHRPPRFHEIDHLLAVHGDHVAPLGGSDEQRIGPHAEAGAHRAVDAAGDQFTGFLKQFFRTSRLHNLLRALG